MKREWEGEPHVLVVTAVELPEDSLDAIRLEYEAWHPESCSPAAPGPGYCPACGAPGEVLPVWCDPCKDEHQRAACRECDAWWAEGTQPVDCAVARASRDGLEASLLRSGTPVTGPGTYTIRAWRRRRYPRGHVPCEHDCGIRVTEGR